MMRRVALGIFALAAFLLVGAELFARYALGLGDPPLTIRDPEIDYLFKPGTYQRFGNTITYNSFSMRADEITPTKADPEELRVLVLGDSVLNGGVLSDDSELATRLAQESLSERLQRPVWVGNVSAGSWGPGNHLAYTSRFGWFDADVVIFMLSSHDIADVPDFVADLGPDFPLQTPALALLEGALRYLPRYLPSLGVAASGHADAPPAPPLEEGRRLLGDALGAAKATSSTVAVLHHLERGERGDEPTPRLHRAPGLIEQTTAQAGIPFIPLVPYLDRATEDPYRDDIHINAVGQRSYADAIVCVVERAQGLQGETCA